MIGHRANKTILGCHVFGKRSNAKYSGQPCHIIIGQHHRSVAVLTRDDKRPLAGAVSLDSQLVAVDVSGGKNREVIGFIHGEKSYPLAGFDLVCGHKSDLRPSRLTSQHHLETNQEVA